jgi:chromosome segregation ATPase
MRSIGKVLAVFTAFGSLAFLGFAWVTAAGGPNWRAEAIDLREDYVVDNPEGGAAYAVRSVRDADQFSKSSPLLPEVVIAARKHKATRQQEQIRELEEQIEGVKTELTNVEQFIRVDLAALAQREAELVAELTALNEQISALTQQGIEKAQAAYESQAEAQRLRNDVARLKTQLDEIRTDRHRAETQQAKLKDLLIRYESQLNALERRNQQLKSTTNPQDYNPMPAQ